MKHAGSAALGALEDLLIELRSLPELRERKRGVFYCASVAFLHFHEDPSGLYADVKKAGDFIRLRVNSDAERRALVTLVRATCASQASAGKPQPRRLGSRRPK